MSNSKLITFDSGVRLEIVKKPSNMVQASLKIAFLVGSEDEETEQGLAHLLEHCTFKGTREFSQEQLSIELDKICAMPNASTSAEFTIYEAKFPKFNVARLFELYSKMIFESAYDENGIESEKLVIIEEIKMHNDVPSDLAFDQLTNTMYRDTGLGFDIAGDPKLLKAVTRNELLQFRDSHYIPENTIISVVGDFDEEEIVQLVNKHFVSRFSESSQKVAIKKRWTETVDQTPVRVAINKSLNQANVMMGCYTVGYESPDRFKIATILFILGGSMSSRLFVKLRNQLSLCYSIYADHFSYKNNGFVLIDFSTSAENLDTAIDAVKREIDEIVSNGVSDEEFELAKNVLLSNFLMGQDIPQSHISYIAYTDKLFNEKEKEQEIRNLKKKDCEEAFKKYILSEKFFVSTVK